MNNPSYESFMSLIEDNALKNIFQFLIEAGKLKSVLRQTYMPDQNRFENSAEHSWHICLAALTLKNYANEDVQIDKVIQMLVLHDLGEIYVGDTFLYNQSKDQNKKEYAAIVEMFSTLPLEMKDEFIDLWTEFEMGKTAEAKFAQSIDRFLPFLYQLQNQGESWKRYKIDKNKALDKNKHIHEGSSVLWDNYQIIATKADELGLFYKKDENN